MSRKIGAENENIKPVTEWQESEVQEWAKSENLAFNTIHCLHEEGVDGQILLSLTEDDVRDFRFKFNHMLRFRDLKKLWMAVHDLQTKNSSSMLSMGFNDNFSIVSTAIATTSHRKDEIHYKHQNTIRSNSSRPQCMSGSPMHYGSASSSNNSSEGAQIHEAEIISPPLITDGRATSIPPEFFKTAISLGYSFLVTWITSFVMVIVHERVPDMKRYPPLPDIFLDNVPHIPWAFHMCEITGTVLFLIWSCVCILHKYRMVLLRRFFALAGTVFLLRCVTMLITSLSVPGTHLQCNPNDHKVDDTGLSVAEAIQLRISRAYSIWSGLGMSIQGVRTCGDYMFSGHTVALTLLNFFITEYTPRNLYFLHTMTWLLNMFGIFFILAAHEHYSIDVFVAFYIASRLFLYYHTLANNQALMSRDSNRTRIWFPMFSYFESSVDGIIPNEYDNISTLLANLFKFITFVKDSCMLTARRCWIDQYYLSRASRNIRLIRGQKNVGTSTSNSVNAPMTTTTAQQQMPNINKTEDESIPLLLKSSNVKITTPD